MAYVSTIFSGAACLGVLIGLISGIFFLVLTALKWVSRVQANLFEEELKRKKRFLINNNHSASDDISNFSEADKTENGFENAFDKNNSHYKIDQQSNTESGAPWSENQKCIEEPKKQEPNTNTVKVRELIEKMVEAILEGPLDGTTVGQLSTHPTWRNSFDLASTDLKLSNLKRLIKRILSEAMTLPNIQEILNRPKSSKEAVREDFENKSYEDILATAILNKIIEIIHNKNCRESETFDINPRPRLRNKRKNKVEDINFDGDWSDTSRSDQLSLTIEEYIEEVTTALEASDSEESDTSDFEKTSNRRIPFPESGKTFVEGTDDENSDLEEQNNATELVTSTSSWEENWLFQKKRLRSTPNAHHPVPVPMLVPNPSEDFRALVGGVDADELSDISDYSDLILEDLSTVEETSSGLLNKETEAFYNLNSNGDNMMGNAKQIQNIIKEESIWDSKHEEIFNSKISAKKSNCEDAFKEDENCSTQKSVQNDENKLNGPTLPEVVSQRDRDSSIENFSHQYKSISDNSASEGSIKISTETENFNRRCSKAEKEKEKWMNPVPLIDNPYSAENVQKREQKKNDFFRIGTYTGELITFPNDIPSEELFEKGTEKQRFSRDYYVNASKYPSGIISPSFNQNQKKTEQKFTDVILSEGGDKFLVTKIQDKSNAVIIKDQIMDKSHFHLPNVKELAKQFAMDENKESQRPNGDSQTKLDSKQNTRSVLLNELPEKVPEIDYSTIPVSEIILTLQQSVEPSASENNLKHKLYDRTQPTTRMEIYWKDENNLIAENPMENLKPNEKIEPLRFNGKQVHSLTARSISKEFREGLKNSQKVSYQGVSKTDRISSGGESDQGDIISNKMKTSPTPTINLKNMKKFWEEIITANSNSSKQK